MHLTGRAHIETAGRILEDEQRGVALESAGEDDLLLIATGERAGADIGTGRHDVEPIDQLGCSRAGGSPVDPRAARPSRIVAQPQHHILGDAHCRNQSFGGPVLRHEGHRSGDVDSRKRAESRDGAKHLAVAVSFDRSNTDQLAAAKLNPADPSCHAERNEGADARVTAASLLALRDSLFPNHRLRQRPLRLFPSRAAQRHDPPPEHRHPVRRRTDFLELVGDERHRAAGLDELPNQREELVDLGRRENGGRLVEQQNSRSGRECLENLQPLALGHTQGVHPSAQVEAFH